MPHNPDKTRHGFPKAGPTGRVRNDLEALVPRRPGPRLTARDVTILQWIARHGIVTTDQIATACFGSTSAAYKRLQALSNMGLIRRDSAWHRAPKIVRVSPAGARIADVGVGPARLILAQVPHDVAVVDLSLDLVARNKGAAIQTERELRGDLYRTKERLHRIPDLVLTLKNGTVVAVELDLSHKDTRRVEAVIRAYEQQTKRFAQLWWFVDGKKSAERYAATVKAKRADDIITVHPWTA